MSLSHLRMSTETPFLREKKFIIGLDCSQSPIFSWDCLETDIARLTVNDGHLDFQMYRGGGSREL